MSRDITGSLYDRSNLQAACFMCNRAKGDSVGPTCEVCGTSQHLFYGPTERAGGHTLLPQDGPASREW